MFVNRTAAATVYWCPICHGGVTDNTRQNVSPWIQNTAIQDKRPTG